MVYVYACKCTEFEEMRKVVDRDEGVGEVCPLCKGKIKRVITSSSFILKGSCWEKDGYSTHLGDAVKRGGFKSE